MLSALSSRYTSVDCPSDEMIIGKTVIITGANKGIGKQTAIELAKREARVAIVCRNFELAKKAVDEIKSESGSENVVMYKMDLASFTSIRECAKSILEKEKRIDILINNAGLMMPAYGKTVDGLEQQIGVNHFGHFLFTMLLLPKLKEAKLGKIIVVTSAMHAFGKMNFDDLNSENSYSRAGAYNQSKLANSLFVLELSEQLKDTNVRVYAVHPGVVQTELGKDLNPLFAFIWKIGSLVFAKTIAQGAQTSIYCAVSSAVNNDTGLYYSDCKVRAPANAALDKNAAKRLWELSLEVTGLKQAQLTNIDEPPMKNAENLIERRDSEVKNAW